MFFSSLNIYHLFNWSIIALQCCVNFCRTTTWISLKHTYPLPPEPPFQPSPSHPSAPSQSEELSPGVGEQLPTGFQFTELKRNWKKRLSPVWLSATPYSPWTSPGQNWRRCGLPFPSPGDLPKPGVEPGSPALQADYDRVYVSATPSVLLPSPTMSTSSSCFIFLHSIYYCLTTHTAYISDNTIYIFSWLSVQLTNPKPPMTVNSMRAESLCVFLSPPNPSS